MKIGAIIAARMSSKRLPGKVLRKIQDKPLLWYILSRLELLPTIKHNLVIATSSMTEDDIISHFGADNGIPVFRGELDRVAIRLHEAAKINAFDYFFRINGDSPFVDIQLYKQAIAALDERQYDLVTNLLVRSYPYGVSVELIKTSAMAKAIENMSCAEDFEHSTQVFYRNPDRFEIKNILRQGENLQHLRLTIDNAEDLKRFENFITIQGVARWTNFSYLDAICIYENCGAKK